MMTEVVIVGGGPAGLAVSASLNLLSIPNIVLEKEDCYAPLWKKWSYDCVKLHIRKQYCELPHMPHSAATPTFMSKDRFITYLDAYAARFGVCPLCGKYVESAGFDGDRGLWVVTARDVATGNEETYTSRFLVVATGENSEGVVPEIPGLGSFPGEVLHSAGHKSGAKHEGKRVLVIGSGNSGMEIAFDLYNHGAKTAIAVRGPYGDLSKYGIVKPAKGPFYMKAKTRRSPVIDVGTVAKIKSGEIEVVEVVKEIRGDEVESLQEEEYLSTTICPRLKIKGQNEIYGSGYRRPLQCK